MKIFLLGFFVMALSSVNEAGQSDNGKDKGQEKKTDKSQLDMLLTQVQQLQEESAHQRLRTKEQELKNEELQVQLQDQQLQIQELTKINRNRRRSDDDLDEHVKEMIHAEIDPLIAGLSSCEVGNHQFSPGLASFGVTNTVYFEGNFKRTPKVLAAIKGVYHYTKQTVTAAHNSFWVNAESTTTTKFDLHIVGEGFASDNYYASWIACA